MMENFSSNATTAKIRAKCARLFTAEDLREMAAMRTVPEAAEFISRSARFKEAFAEVDPNTVHRGFLEELLYKENFETYIRLCKFQGLDKEPFFGFLIRRSEIDCILSIINRINSSLDMTYLSDLPGYLIKYLTIPVMELSNSKTYAELVAGLKGTRYAKVLGKIPVREDGKVDYTECELRLRTDYYTQLLTSAEEEFGGSVAEEIKTMILRDIDCRNIINAYRMKAYFGYSPEEIKRRSLKFYGIGKRNMERLYEAPDAETMMDMVNHTLYGKNSPDTDNIEVEINSGKLRRLRHRVAGSTHAPVALYAFIALCDMEVMNLVHIIEGIRYGVEAAVIESLLTV